MGAHGVIRVPKINDRPCQLVRGLFVQLGGGLKQLLQDLGTGFIEIDPGIFRIDFHLGAAGRRRKSFFRLG